jgi:hypothetical protein
MRSDDILKRMLVTAFFWAFIAFLVFGMLMGLALLVWWMFHEAMNPALKVVLTIIFTWVILASFGGFAMELIEAKRNQS